MQKLSIHVIPVSDVGRKGNNLSRPSSAAFYSCFILPDQIPNQQSPIKNPQYPLIRSSVVPRNEYPFTNTDFLIPNP